MASKRTSVVEEMEPLTKPDSTATQSSRDSLDSATSVSTTSMVLEGLNDSAEAKSTKPKHTFEYRDEEDDIEAPGFTLRGLRQTSRGTKRLVWIVSVVAILGWSLALISFLISGRYRRPSTIPYDHDTPTKASGKKVTLDQVQSGQWYPTRHTLSWIEGANGEDGLILERAEHGKDYLVVEDVRNRKSKQNDIAAITLMKSGTVKTNSRDIYPHRVWPSPDFKKVLIESDDQKNWRHSYTGIYWIFDVATQKAEPLDPQVPNGRIQLASWAPTSDSVVYTRDNNMYLRILSSNAVRQITKDGGPELFYGVPDWVYEEEVFSSNVATWWDKEGKFVAYLRTNETMVPEYPVQYFLSRPSGEKAPENQEAYPEVRQIKYPKAGAPNPTVDLEFYDVARAETFTVDINGGFSDDDRLIIEVLWASNGRVLVRETNRESDVIRLVLVDVKTRTGKLVRKQDVSELDGGWVEPTQSTVFVPADPENGRPNDGYIDTVIHDDNDHLAYFSPLDSDKPVMLTSGDFEVVKAPSALDLKNNLVYYVSTEQAPTQRHIYSVKLDGSDKKALVPVDKPGYYDASFSTGAGYMLLGYQGPNIPTQRIVNTPSNSEIYDEMVEENKRLAEMASNHEVPHEIYSTVQIDNFTLPVVERRPAHFDVDRRYPVMFHLYGGPGSQTVDRKFNVDFQSVMASDLGYIVVTVDGRGTGYIGRKARCIIRGNIGFYEARDQIETAKIWAKKKYVDENRIAIWGWSYGGFMTLKTLETDAGQTFKYGMAVAPVTDWRFYDTVYTERYMHTPQHNPGGYATSAISNMTGLRQNVRFLMMHGIADDNVHMQSTLTLIDKLDLAGVENYDVHVFPDSDHSIFFHNANRIVYDKLSNWLVNAFNGEWLKTEDPVPIIK